MVVCDPEVMVITRSDAGKTRCSMVRADGGGGSGGIMQARGDDEVLVPNRDGQPERLFFLVHAPLAAARTLAVTRELP